MTEPVVDNNPIPMPLPEPRTSSHLPIIILAILAVFALTGMGFFYWQNQKMAQQLAMLANSQKPAPAKVQPSSPPTTIADLPAGWKTYSNDKYAFSFDYPQSLDSNIGVVAGPYTGTNVALQTLSDSKTIREGTDAAFDGFSMYVVSDMKASSFDAYVTNELAAMNDASSTFMQGARKVAISNGQSLVTDNRGYYYLQFPSSKKVLVFAYSHSNPSFRSTFNQILETVKFNTPSQTNNTSSWKTYANSTYNFSIKYPAGWVSKQYNPPDNRIPYLSNLQNQYDIQFVYVKNQPIDFTGYTQTTINNIKTYVNDNLQGDDGKYLNYYFQINPDEYISVVAPLSNNPLNVVWDDASVSLAKQIISTFKLNK